MNCKIIICAIPCIFLLFLISCDENNDNIISSLPNGTYNYTAHDSLGTIVAKGTLSFEIKDTTYVQGVWEISKVGDPQNIGPQTEVVNWKVM